MDWSIQDIARLAGTTSRTLRHYGDVGLLEPTRIGSNGYRYYDEQALARLQRSSCSATWGSASPPLPKCSPASATTRRPSRTTRTGWSRRRTASIARSGPCATRSRRWKEVNSSWQRRFRRVRPHPVQG